MLEMKKIVFQSDFLKFDFCLLFSEDSTVIEDAFEGAEATDLNPEDSVLGGEGKATVEIDGS